MRFLLDTDHCSYIQRGHPEVIRRLQTLPRGSEVITSVVSQAELLAGIYQAPSEQRQQELRSLYEHLLLNISDIAPIDSAAAEKFAEVLTLLIHKGRPIPVNDIRIAAIALAHNLVLVTSNTHFQYVEGLQVED